MADILRNIGLVFLVLVIPGGLLVALIGLLAGKYLKDDKHDVIMVIMAIASIVLGFICWFIFH